MTCMKQGSIKISSSRSISKYLNQMKYMLHPSEFNNSISEYKHNTVNTPYHLSLTWMLTAHNKCQYTDNYLQYKSSDNA